MLLTHFWERFTRKHKSYLIYFYYIAINRALRATSDGNEAVAITQRTEKRNKKWMKRKNLKNLIFSNRLNERHFFMPADAVRLVIRRGKLKAKYLKWNNYKWIVSK